MNSCCFLTLSAIQWIEFTASIFGPSTVDGHLDSPHSFSIEFGNSQVLIHRKGELCSLQSVWLDSSTLIFLYAWKLLDLERGYAWKIFDRTSITCATNFVLKISRKCYPAKIDLQRSWTKQIAKVHPVYWVSSFFSSWSNFDDELRYLIVIRSRLSAKPPSNVRIKLPALITFSKLRSPGTLCTEWVTRLD